MSFAHTVTSMLRSVSANGGERLRVCESCGTKNDITVNTHHCWDCRHKWGEP